jgi:glutamate--cysteine ligase
LSLETRDGPRELSAWAAELLDAIGSKTDLLDAAHGGSAYADALALQGAKARGQEELPSERMLRELREGGIPFSRLALSYSDRWAKHFLERPLDSDVEAQLVAEGVASLERQRAVEAADSEPFETYLSTYYEQYRAIRADI